MEVTLAFLADAANTTASQKLNVLGMFSNLGVPGFPYVHPIMTLVVKFEAGPAEAGTDQLVEIVLVEPGGQTVYSIIPEPLHLPDDHDQPVEVLLQVSIEGVRFDRAGPHAFVVILSGEAKFRVPINIAEN